MASKGTKCPKFPASKKYVGVAELGTGGSFWTAVKSNTKSGYRWVPYVTKHKTMSKRGHVKTSIKKKRNSRKRKTPRKSRSKRKMRSQRLGKRTSKRRFSKRRFSRRRFSSNKKSGSRRRFSRSSTKKWIKNAIKKPGSLTKYAKKVAPRKAFTKRGTLKTSWLKKVKKNGPPKQKRRASLALTLKKFKNK